jgi:hypothetical protein
VTFSCTFPVNVNFAKYWLNTVYFLADGNETFRLFSSPSTDVPISLIEKYQKIKYVIFDRPPIWGSGNGQFVKNLLKITAWIPMKIGNLSAENIRFKKENKLLTIGQVVFAPHPQTYATIL